MKQEQLQTKEVKIEKIYRYEDGNFELIGIKIIDKDKQNENTIYVILPLEPEVTKNVAPPGLSGWDLHEYEMSQWETTKPDQGGITWEESMDLKWGGTGYDWREAYGW